MALERTQGGESYQRTTKAEKNDSRGISGPATGIVTCGDCQSYQANAENPARGLGRCSLTLTGLPPAGGNGYRAPFPFSRRTCSLFAAREETL